MDLIVPVMRKSSLHRVIEYYIGVGPALISSITVVDFDPSWTSSLLTANTLQSYPHTYIAISSQRHFNKSVALNIGINISPDDMLLMCDADVMIDINTLLEWKRRAGQERCFTLSRVEESLYGESRPAPGILLAHKRVLVEIKGYSNVFKGWGMEDRDILGRLSLTGLAVETHGQGLHLSHDEDERTRNYYSNDRLKMRERNAHLLEARISCSELYGTFDEDIELDWEITSHVARHQ